MPLTLTANAKINLGLRIVGRREDGYHLIHTLFQEIDFGDNITMSDQPAGEISLEVTGTAADKVPTDQQNLCLQAARLFKERTKTERGVDIRLDKHIPMGAGLGGGSSDAAAVLRGLNELWQVGLTPAQLEEMAARIGADVPFFIRGGLQLGAGIGEVLTPLKRSLPQTVVLVIPPYGVDTTWAYNQFAGQESFPAPPAFDALISQEPVPWEVLTNDFEDVVFPRYPKLAEIKAALVEQGAAYVSLSGSGSTVYGLFEELVNESDLKERFPDTRSVTCQAISGN